MLEDWKIRGREVTHLECVAIMARLMTADVLITINLDGTINLTGEKSFINEVFAFFWYCSPFDNYKWYILPECKNNLYLEEGKGIIDIITDFTMNSL